ncbi:MAG: SelL-related redox protein [Phycisphaerales bacterium]
MDTDSLAEAMDSARTNTGESLGEMSRRGPVLVVFLRHFGCPFCREAAADVQRRRDEIERGRVRVVLVHQGTEDQAEGWFAARGLGDVPRIADPDRALYRAFELKRGNPWQLFGPKVWWRALQALVAGHLIGKSIGGATGDAFQMQGAFLVRDGAIVKAYRHRSQADRPDYVALARGAGASAGGGAENPS